MQCLKTSIGLSKSDHSVTKCALSIANSNSFPDEAKHCTLDTFSGLAIHSGVTKIMQTFTSLFGSRALCSACLSGELSLGM